MGFKTDGSVHHGGIANELQTIATLNSLGIFADEVSHLGGTQHKADAVAGARKISIKRKQGTKVGSFDWVNTTKVPSIIAKQFDGFRAIITELKSLTPEQRADEVDEVRAMFNQTSAAAFDSFLTAELTAFLRDTFAKQAGYDIIITDTKAGTLHHFESEQHPVFSLLADGFIPVLKAPSKDGQTSRSILFAKGDSVIDCGLRLRITSNNGINAFLGLSKSNATSSVVLKLQQDNVSGLLESVGAASYAV